MIYLIAGKCNMCGEFYYRPITDKFRIIAGCNCQGLLNFTSEMRELFFTTYPVHKFEGNN